MSTDTSNPSDTPSTTDSPPPDTAKAPYLLYIYVGDGNPKLPGAISVVNITPISLTLEDTVSTLAAAALTAADLRTRTLFVAGPGSVERAVLVYAALCGFAGRHLDFTDMLSVTDARAMHDSMQEVVDTGKPLIPDERLVIAVGASFDVTAELSIEEFSKIRYSRQVLFVADQKSVRESLEALVTCNGIRARGTSERFPVMLPANLYAEFDISQEVLPVECVDLEVLRKHAAQLRRDRRIDDRGEIVAAEEVSPRCQKLIDAAMVDPTLILVRLGSVLNEETGFWRCPRPERHRNGDANPSARVQDNSFRCFRCDLEHIDSLRLVMDTKNLCPDDAADWITTQ